MKPYLCQGSAATYISHPYPQVLRGNKMFLPLWICMGIPFPPVGLSLTLRSLEFFNMHGNVSEGVADWYADYPKGLSATDPTGPFISPRALSLPDLRGKRMRVTRGGAWNRSAGRSAARDSLQYQRSSPHVGFRVALKESR